MTSCCGDTRCDLRSALLDAMDHVRPPPLLVPAINNQSHTTVSPSDVESSPTSSTTDLGKGALFQLDVALQLEVHQTRRSDVTLARVLQLAKSVPALKDTKDTDDFRPSASSDQLSKAERLILDLLTVSSPDLYQLHSLPTWRITNSSYILGKDRIAELQRRVRQSSSDTSKTTEFGILLQQYRQQQQIKTESSAIPTIHPKKKAKTTTFDLLNQSLVTIPVAANSRTDSSSKAVPNQKSWAVRVADLLWGHASRRGPSLQQEMYTLTLKDAFAVLKEQWSPASAAPKRRALAECLIHLHETIPSFLSLSDPDIDQVRPDTTVWIHPAVFKDLRWKVAGDSPHAKQDGKTVGTRPLLKKRPSDEYPRQSKEKKSRELLDGDPQDHRKRSSDPVDASPMDHPQVAPPKSRRLLRVNPHLILSDADYDGGEILPKRNFTSPRGLKRLFDSMVAGERI